MTEYLCDIVQPLRTRPSIYYCTCSQSKPEVTDSLLVPLKKIFKQIYMNIA